MRLGVMIFTNFSRHIRACRIEITQAYGAHLIRMIKIAQYLLNH